jgi:hypothetical protein
MCVCVYVVVRVVVRVRVAACEVAPEVGGWGWLFAVPAALGKLFCWHKGPALRKEAVDLQLTFRIATTADVRAEGKVRSRHLWQGAKDKSQRSGRGQGKINPLGNKTTLYGS